MFPETFGVWTQEHQLTYLHGLFQRDKDLLRAVTVAPTPVPVPLPFTVTVKDPMTLPLKAATVEPEMEPETTTAQPVVSACEDSTLPARASKVRSLLRAYLLEVALTDAPISLSECFKKRPRELRGMAYTTFHRAITDQNNVLPLGWEAVKTHLDRVGLSSGVGRKEQWVIQPTRFSHSVGASSDAPGHNPKSRAVDWVECMKDHIRQWVDAFDPSKESYIPLADIYRTRPNVLLPITYPRFCTSFSRHTVQYLPPGWEAVKIVVPGRNGRSHITVLQPVAADPSPY